MAFKNTENQQKIIDHREGNILVSAGAGSGKTTVLTSHIIDRLNDKDNPIDIDRLLIVTFTKAAAAEMKERIASQIKDIRSKTLLNHSHISTIDSFCSWIVKNNFEKIDLDPDFTMISDGELTLIKHEIFDEIMEKMYSDKNDAFISFLDSYTNGKNDDNIFEIIDSLYNKSMSQVDPKAYFSKIKEMSITNDDVMDIYPMQTYSDKLIKDTRYALKDFELYGSYAKDKLAEVYPQNLELINNVRACNNITELSRFLDATDKIMFKSKRAPFTEGDQKYFDYRYEINEYLKSLRTMLRGLKGFDACYKETIPHLEIIFDLLNTYYDRVQAEKKERNLADFADIEHFALDILINNEAISSQIRDCFDEILIDEYQDSNELQEAIFNCIAKEGNLFMVGDIKQSIYGFRNAEPSLFINRYNDYKTDNKGLAIDLTENFRCRQEVVDSVNEVFEAIMSEDIGGSDYKHTSKLQRFASYSEPESEGINRSELIVIKSNYGKNYRINLEASYIAERIKKIIDSGMLVYDKELDINRPVMYKDIAIIMRNIKKPIEAYSAIFNKENIPAVTTRSTGYFDSAEIKLLLNALSIIDNPRQDIPLCSVLLSPMVGFTNDDLAKIRCSYSPCSKAGAYNDFYDALINANDEKVIAFLEKLKNYRRLSKSYKILDLINIILKDTGYEYYVKSLKGGENRLANIDMLKEFAKEYERTSYSGIYDFCRFISNIKKKDINLDEANTLSNNENVVRIMTIHASKGLEYPIVFLTGLSNKFNLDNQSEISVNSNYGIALTCKNAEKSIKVNNFLKTIINDFNREDMVSEEMRLLYVAMTRAREKLILVTSEGRESKYINTIDKYNNNIIPGNVVKKANSMHDLIMMAMPEESFKNIDVYEMMPSADLKTVYKIEYPNSIEYAHFTEELSRTSSKSLDFNFEYHNDFASKIKGSYGISELNLKSQDMGSDPAEQALRSKAYHFEPGGAEVGTAYHTVFEKIDPTKAQSQAYVDDVISSLTQSNKITEDVACKLKSSKITAFYGSDIGRGAVKAFEVGKLEREKAFVMGIPACEFDNRCKDEELIIVQGVIDMYYEDDEGIVLIDYKSNVILPGEEEVLINKYKTQIEYYAKAIEAATSKKVCKKYLYSISLECFIEVK